MPKLTPKHRPDQRQAADMANQSDYKPFPRTPYPFEQQNTDEFAGLASISDWLELSLAREEYHPEANALTPEDWIACNGQEDSTWVVGEPEWLEEVTAGAEIISGAPSRAESIPSPADVVASISDLSSPQDTLEEKSSADGEASHPTQPPAADVPLALCPPPNRGVIRRRGSEEELQLPERKRPRLERRKRLELKDCDDRLTDDGSNHRPSPTCSRLSACAYSSPSFGTNSP